MSATVWSIGHSNLPFDAFVGLLAKHGIRDVVDVRTVRRSRFAPWADGTTLAGTLRAHDVSYVAMGDTLGGRPSSSDLIKDGIADYEAMARSPFFPVGLKALVARAAEKPTAMMCSEGDPLTCHRCLLVGRALASTHEVIHVLRDGSAMTQDAVVRTLLAKLPGGGDLFEPEPSEAEAYRAQALKVAWRAQSTR